MERQQMKGTNALIWGVQEILSASNFPRGVHIYFWMGSTCDKGVFNWGLSHNWKYSTILENIQGMFYVYSLNVLYLILKHPIFHLNIYNLIEILPRH